MRLMRYISLLLLLTVSTLRAADPWVGTWKSVPSKMRVDPPSWFHIVIDGDGFRYSTSGGLSYRASLNGKEYPVSGSSTYNAIKWRRIDSHTVEATRLKDGDAIGIETHISSPNGHTRTATLKGTRNSGGTFEIVTVYVRTGGDTSPSNPLVGEWEIDTSKNDQTDSATFRFDAIDGGVTFSSGATPLYTAKFNGGDSRVDGIAVFDAVSLRRVDERTIEITQKKRGNIVSTWKYEVSPDGKTLMGTGKRIDNLGRTVTTTTVSERQ